MTINSADDSKISNRTINTNRISNRMYDLKSNRITKLRRSLDETAKLHDKNYTIEFAWLNIVNKHNKQKRITAVLRENRECIVMYFCQVLSFWGLNLNFVLCVLCPWVCWQNCDMLERSRPLWVGKTVKHWLRSGLANSLPSIVFLFTSLSGSIWTDFGLGPGLLGSGHRRLFVSVSFLNIFVFGNVILRVISQVKCHIYD